MRVGRLGTNTALPDKLQPTWRLRAKVKEGHRASRCLLSTSFPFLLILPRACLDHTQLCVYHFGMPNVLYWTLVFTAASIEHLAQRNIEAEDVADAVFGYYGTARVRKGGRGQRTRWFVVAPLAGGELLTCVLREATLRDLEAEGVFVLPATGVPERPGEFRKSMRLCVSAPGGR